MSMIYQSKEYPNVFRQKLASDSINNTAMIQDLEAKEAYEVTLTYLNEQYNHISLADFFSGKQVVQNTSSKEVGYISQIFNETLIVQYKNGHNAKYTFVNALLYLKTIDKLDYFKEQEEIINGSKIGKVIEIPNKADILIHWKHDLKPIRVPLNWAIKHFTTPKTTPPEIVPPTITLKRLFPNSTPVQQKTNKNKGFVYTSTDDKVEIHWKHNPSTPSYYSAEEAIQHLHKIEPKEYFKLNEEVLHKEKKGKITNINNIMIKIQWHGRTIDQRQSIYWAIRNLTVVPPKDTPITITLNTPVRHKLSLRCGFIQGQTKDSVLIRWKDGGEINYYSLTSFSEIFEKIESKEYFKVGERVKDIAKNRIGEIKNINKQSSRIIIKWNNSYSTIKNISYAIKYFRAIPKSLNIYNIVQDIQTGKKGFVKDKQGSSITIQQKDGTLLIYKEAEANKVLIKINKEKYFEKGEIVNVKEYSGKVQATTEKNVVVKWDKETRPVTYSNNWAIKHLIVKRPKIERIQDDFLDALSLSLHPHQKILLDEIYLFGTEKYTTDVKYFTGETKMRYEYKTTHSFNGKNIDDCSKQEVFRLMADAEAEIKQLKNIKIKSKVVAKEIQRLEKSLKKLVKYADAHL